MRTFLIDTNILIDFFRDSSKSIISEELLNDAVISYVTLGELLQGARNNQEKNLIMTICEKAEVNLGSTEISQLSIWLTSNYGISHGVGILDAIIAATALQRDLIVLTKNTKHFTCIEGLQVQSRL